MERDSTIQQLALYYLNERSCHRILSYNRDLVERVLVLLSRQKRELESISCRMAVCIYQVEIDRIEWLLTEYLLIRLEKIRTYIHLDSFLLSDQEKEYHQSYTELLAQSGIYIKKEDIPSRFDRNAPNYSGIYFLEDVSNLSLEGEALSFSAGDFIIADVQCIFDLVDSLQVLLV